MLRKTHMAVGLATTSILVNDIKSAVIVGGFAALGSLMPDLDAPAANIVKRIQYISYICLLSFTYIYFTDKAIPFILLSILTIFGATREHRTFTHSILSMLAFTACITFINNLAALAFLIGYALHLFCDSLTIMGIPLLYPFIEDRIGFKKIKTGGEEDKGIGAMALLMYLSIIAK